MRGKTKHQDRLFSYVPIEQRVSKTHLTEVVAEGEREGLISKDHFTVDGTVVQAWASLKSFQKKQDADADKKNDIDTDNDPKGKNPDVNFHGEKRSNETHESTTDPESQNGRANAANTF